LQRDSAEPPPGAQGLFVDGPLPGWGTSVHFGRACTFAITRMTGCMLLRRMQTPRPPREGSPDLRTRNSSFFGGRQTGAGEMPGLHKIAGYLWVRVRILGDRKASSDETRGGQPVGPRTQPRPYLSTGGPPNSPTQREKVWAVWSERLRGRREPPAGDVMVEPSRQGAAGPTNTAGLAPFR